MENRLKILYVDLGGVALYSCDKTAGRILGWAVENSDVFLLAPELIKATAQREIGVISDFPERINIITLPFSSKIRISGAGIIYSYFLRILFSPYVLFKKISKLDIGYSNSPVLVDIIPILLLKLFGRCRHWILMMDSIVPPPSRRTGSVFVNFITYWESRLVIQIANHFATAIFTVNPELRDSLASSGMKKKKIFLTQNGLFMSRIDKVLDYRRNQYAAVYMGRITENKGIFDLITAWQEIIKTIPGAKLAILGTGREEVVKNFVNAIKEKKLDNNIDYLGYVAGDKRYEILKASKIFLFLSKVNADESWGISLMESLACGLPAVTYDLEIYKHIYPEDILLKSAVGDIDSVVKKAVLLLNNDERRQLLSKKSLVFAKQFDWFKIAAADLNKIQEIIKI